MRVALISYEFPPATLGGTGTYAHQAAHMLAARGHEVVVFAGHGGAPQSQSECEGPEVVRLPCSDRTQFHLPAVNALAARHAQHPFDLAEIPDQCAEGAGLRATLPDLPIVLRSHLPAFIAHEIEYHALSRGARGCWALRRIVGGLRHGANLRKVFREARARFDFRAHFDLAGDYERAPALEADLVVAPSHRMAARLRDAWAINANKIRIIPNPYQPSPTLLALPPPTDTGTIAFHGSVDYVKGVAVLVAAMSHVLRRHPNAQLVLAGRSQPSPIARASWRGWLDDSMLVWRDTLTSLEPQLAALGDRVQVKGFIAPSALADHLAAATVCVFPSLFDNFPGACLEAMGAGRPIVATRSGGMEDMLGNGEAGLLVPCADAASLATAICRLLDDSQLRATLATKARVRLLKNYTPAALAPHYEALYAEVIALRAAAVKSAERTLR